MNDKPRDSRKKNDNNTLKIFHLVGKEGPASNIYIDAERVTHIYSGSNGETFVNYPKTTIMVKESRNVVQEYLIQTESPYQKRNRAPRKDNKYEAAPVD